MSNLIHNKLKKNQIQLLLHAIKYGIIGFGGAVVDFAVFILLVHGFNLHTAMLVAFANICSSVIGTVNNYLLNARFNFKVRTHLWVRFARYFTFSLVSTGFVSICLGINQAFLHIPTILAKVIFSSLGAVISFLLNNYLTFQTEKQVVKIRNRLRKSRLN